MDELLIALKKIVGDANVLDKSTELFTYECDGFSIARGKPLAVVLPRTTAEVSQVMKLLSQHDVEIVPRGNGTGLAGGCVAYAAGVIVCTAKMEQILDVSLPNMTATVEAGVRNTALSQAVKRLPGGEGLHFAPDPSSQNASTIGGNAATNAGGLHTLKYGVSSNHILGLEMVLPDGEVVVTGGMSVQDHMGPDLTGLYCGSEGTLGIITKVQVRLTREPETNFRTAVGVFSKSTDASQAVADITAAGIIPAAMEMLDGVMVRVIEDAFHYGFPADAAALLLVEVDGIDCTLDEQLDAIVKILEKNNADDIQFSSDPEKRAELWSARRKAFGAIGRVSPSYCTQDACVPRSTLPDVIAHIEKVSEKYGLTIANVFHAGDGNVHPILLFDENDPKEVEATMAASHEILAYCIEIGGALTGEHGVGVEKLDMMPVMFDRATLNEFLNMKAAHDPDELINAGKLLPSEKIKVDLLKPVGTNIPGGAL